jgi:hypothetical protein
MPWFRIDDQFHSHPKGRRAGLEALGLWSIAGSWSMNYKTDGFAPEWFVVSWKNGKKLAASLVTANLWESGEKDGELGWFFHDWSDFQMTAQEIEAEREKSRQRQRDRRQRQRDTEGTSPVTSPDVTVDVTRDVPRDVQRESQDPSHPIPSSSSKKRTTSVADAPHVDIAGRRDRFDEFWAIKPTVGPKRSNPKEEARKVWDRLVRSVDPDEILVSARLWAKTRQGEDPQYTPQAKTWLNQKRWADDVETSDAQPALLIPEPPTDCPGNLIVAWKRAHRQAQENGRPGPSDWHELQVAS